MKAPPKQRYKKTGIPSGLSKKDYNRLYYWFRKDDVPLKENDEEKEGK